MTITCFCNHTVIWNRYPPCLFGGGEGIRQPSAGRNLLTDRRESAVETQEFLRDHRERYGINFQSRIGLFVRDGKKICREVWEGKCQDAAKKISCLFSSSNTVNVEY